MYMKLKHQNNKIQTLRKKKQIEMNSPDFQKDEIITPFLNFPK